MKKQLYILLFSLSLAFPTMAQQKDTTASFSLQDAISYAQQHQSDIKNAKIDEQIAINTVKQTIGIGLPQLSANANFQDYLKVPTSLLPGEFFGAPGTQIPVKFGVKYNSGVGLELNQLLFDGSYLVGLKASRTYKELSVKATGRTRIETTVAVTKAYYSVLVSNEQLSLIDANLERLKKSLNDTEQMLKNGFVEKIDVDRLSVLNNNLLTERENVIRLLALNVNLLKFQMGMTVGSSLTLTDKISDVNVDKTPVIGTNDVYNKRIEYSLLQTQKKLNELDVKRYKSLFLPSLSAFGSTSANFQADKFSNLYDKRFPTTVIGLRLSVPLISGGQKLYQLRNAKLESLKTDNNLINLQNAIELEVAQSQTIYLNGQKSLENQKRNMELAKEVLRVTKIKYDQGVGSSLEVTTAETSLKEAQNNYINALYDMLINKVNLDKALGNINY
ncbi:TolC family protein [Pedobacter sp. LMG 31464]|uniref:TolC family protein n=1 Tax=Pedobacter planticolens TaxID=2679964 RepID=A0A923DZ67_9SPHI|nr:TolC family protein [Pedobacter planticolens]MBB2146779.1 TolC family protein [Pedobacter planticolens]